MEEVIFNGTASRKSRGMAEVTLVIDNSNGILPIDYNEVAITRRMYRSGESEYLINNNQCRLRDIRELIMDTGIGVDGYSIIGQGQAAQIMSQKTEERRVVFEEAAGISKYRYQREAAEKNLSKTLWKAVMKRIHENLDYRSFDIPASVTVLEEDAFEDCDELTMVAVPSHLAKEAKACFPNVDFAILD